MKKYKIKIYTVLICLAFGLVSCVPELYEKNSRLNVPDQYSIPGDSINTGSLMRSEFFSDQFLIALIDTAIKNNQELNIIMREIEISKNEVQVRKGEYLPFIDLRAGAEVEKVGRYTSQGANDANTEIEPEMEFPDPLSDFVIGAFAHWELDVWKKLRNGKKSALIRYLSSVEGRNFMVTNLVAEIADAYYELLALDNQLDIVRQNIEIQRNALKIVRTQKQAARLTELAVQKFEAEVLRTQSFQFEILQKIVETENHINFLIGRFPQPIERSSRFVEDFMESPVTAGIPAQLLENRPDIKQSELLLEASKIDLKIAKANFYPSFGLSTGLGFQAFNPAHLIRTPESVLYSIAGDVVAPLVNRNAIKANYKNANAKQIQAIYEFEQTVLNAYVEVSNQVSRIQNLDQSYLLKEQQVQTLNKSIHVANVLFKSARADYMEVLLTQRDALESRFELVETRKEQMLARVNLYRALGGGWN